MKALLISAYVTRTCKRPGPIARWLIAAVLGSATMATAGMALAQTAPAKPKRPALCINGRTLSDKHMVVYVCLDGKKPRVFTRFYEVKFVDENGQPKVYTLGWTAPLEKRGQAFVAEGTPKLERIVTVVQ